MQKLKKLGLGALLVFIGALISQLPIVRAQAPSVVVQYATGAHATCTVNATLSTFCFATDGLYFSANGGAFAQVGAAQSSGVASLTVCNATGANCGTAQTGAITLKVPSTATTTVSVNPPPFLLTSGNLTVGSPTATAATTLQ